MRPTLRMRFWVDAVLAGVSGASLALTFVWSDWIELLTGSDPDRGSGFAEWAIVALSMSTLILFATLSRYEWRRAVAVRA
jgi:hypothetical protein